MHPHFGDSEQCCYLKRNCIGLSLVALPATDKDHKVAWQHLGIYQ